MSTPLRPRFRLRDKLLAAVTLLVVVLTVSILLILNVRLQAESSKALNADLDRTFSIFSSFVSQETSSLRDKAVLMAGLPRLTAALDVRKPKFSTMADTV